MKKTFKLIFKWYFDFQIGSVAGDLTSQGNVFLFVTNDQLKGMLTSHPDENSFKILKQAVSTSVQVEEPTNTNTIASIEENEIKVGHFIDEQNQLHMTMEVSISKTKFRFKILIIVVTFIVLLVLLGLVIEFVSKNKTNAWSFYTMY